MSIPPAGSGKNKSRAITSPPPDWLKSDRPGPETTPEQMPGWLKFQPPSGTTPPLEPPGWLAKVLSGGAPPRPAPAASPRMDDSLDALRPAPMDAGPGKPPSAPKQAPLAGDDDLFAALRTETSIPLADESLDWLKPRADQPAEEASALPDWMTSPTAEEKPAAGPADLPDWIGASSAGEKLSETPAGVPDWISSALSEEKPAEPPADLPDWMTGFGAPAAESDESKPAGLPDWMTTAADEAKPAAGPEAPKPDDLPDWMSMPAAEAKPAGSEAPKPDDLSDWMTTPAAEAKPAEETSEPLEWITPADVAKPADEAKLAEPSADLPDWMVAAEAAKPGEEPTSLPDWLTASSAPPAGGEQPPKVPGKSGLLTRFSTGMLPTSSAPDAAGEAEPAAPAEPGGLGETPDWLDALSQKDAGPKPEAPSPEPSAEVPSSPEASSLTLPPAAPTKTPDWLEELAREESAELPPAPDTVSASDAPDWLDMVMKDDSAPAPAAPASDEVKAEPEMPAVPIPEPSAPAETPDWLDQLAKSEPETPAAPAPAAPTETPDWLDQLAKTEPETPAAPIPEPSVPAAPTETPDWLDQLAKTEPQTPAAPAPEPSAPAASTETPDWLDQLAKSEPETPAAPTPEPSAPAASVETPAAPPAPLPDLAAAEPSEPAPAVAQPAGDDLSDLLSGMDLGMPAAPAGAGEDLLGMSGDLAAAGPLMAEGGEPEAGPPDDLPEWLRTMQAAPDRPEKSEVQEAPLPAEALGDIDDLRFDKLVGAPETPQPQAAEKVGALKDVVGAIRPELIFDAQTLKGGHLTTEMTVTREQSQRIEMLEGLLGDKTEEVPLSGPGRRTLPIVRWVVAVLLIAAVALPIVMNFTLLSEPATASSGPADARDMLGSLSGESKIVIAFDYEPDISAEMDPLALAILGRVAEQTGASVYAVSTRATGPALAQRAIDQTLADADQTQRDRWLNLGYLPGGPNGISALVVGGPQGLPNALSLNALGQSSGVAEASLGELKPTLIIVLTASADDLRAWVEQAGRPTGIPMIAATSVGNMPMAAPYRQSKQVSALLSGVNDAVAFRSLTDQKPDPAAVSIWNTQATGALAATLLIIVGGAIYGITALRDHQEQGS